MTTSTIFLPAARCQIPPDDTYARSSARNSWRTKATSERLKPPDAPIAIAYTVTATLTAQAPSSDSTPTVSQATAVPNSGRAASATHTAMNGALAGIRIQQANPTALEISVAQAAPVAPYAGISRRFMPIFTTNVT